MMFKFQTYYDLSTSASSVQVITVKVGGKELQKRCTHLLGAYKWYKFGRASVKLIPAATLPVDPQGMSYASDDPQTVDPRDQLNPGLCRVTNGEDVFTHMADLTAEQQERMYRTSMLDPRWSKFMLQHGFFRSATPLLWSIAELHQDAYPGSNINVPYNTSQGHTTPAEAADSGTFDGEKTYGVQSISPQVVHGGDAHPAPAPYKWNMIYKEGISSDRALIQTGHKVRMQWLPTDMLQGVSGSDTVNEQYYTGPNVCPTVPLMTIVLPKANKTLYYYRLYITQTVYFSGPRQVSPVSDGAVVCGFDNFLLGRAVTMSPKHGIVPNYNPNVYDNGDNS